MANTTVIVDPYHPQLGALAHLVSQRLVEDTQKIGDEDDFTVTSLFSRLWALDPTVLVLAVLDSESGELVGYSAASIEGNQAFMMQPRFEKPTENDATGELLTIAERWIKDYNTAMGAELITRLTLVTRRFDPKWEKKYGFETKRYILTKKLGE